MDESLDAAPSAPPAPPSLGETLARERERLGLSRSEVAQRLHMSVSQVDAIEAGDYARLPKGPFLRGFVRNYAKIVGREPEPLVAMLAAAPRDASPRIVVPSQNIRFGNERLANSPYVKAGVMGMVVVAIGFAVMYWWLFVKPAPPAQQQVNAPEVVAPAKSQLAAPPAELQAPKAEPAPVPAEPPKMDEPKAVTPPPAQAKPAEAPKPEPKKAATAAGSARLKFAFKGDSWVEVRDASGAVLVSKLNPRGTEAEISGKRPLTVIVGNAPDVTMLLNDREFPLEPHTKVAVARFTVE